MYDSDMTIEELRERQQRKSNMKYIKHEPCRGYDYEEDEDDPHDMYPEDKYAG